MSSTLKLSKGNRILFCKLYLAKQNADLRRDLKESSFTLTEQTVGIHPKFAGSLGMKKMDNWDFAIYRHSRNLYDSDEWMFPGAGHVNGTIEGAMKAGMEAYPM
jgi:hypothetical protein